MKLVYESELHGWDESAETIYIYGLDDNEEYWRIDEMTHDEKCDMINVMDESGYNIMPSAIYHTYSFELTINHLIVIETTAYNV